MRAVFLAAGLLAALCSSAHADSSGKSRCGWVARGVYACESTYETPYSTTYTLCGSGGIDTACTTKTKEKDPEPAAAPHTTPPSVEHIPNGAMMPPLAGKLHPMGPEIEIIR
jgi:hypothetical protein